MAETKSSTSKTLISDIDPIHHLPLPLLRSATIPPAPPRSDSPGSAIDWLPCFSDHSWIAYGASSLLVISHFPSPLYRDRTALGPIFRQVFELSGGDSSSDVTAVSWSPVTPSVGEVATVCGTCVWVFGHDSATSKGSFCWSQNAILVQSSTVEAVGWTGSGDGIIACGAEVFLWRRRNRFWEIAWKFKADQPQTLVSATWTVVGPFATASFANLLQDEGLLVDGSNKYVYVYQNDGKLGYVKNQLNHPLTVSMVQWRPMKGRTFNRDGKNAERHLLLTCCVDGTVRLWREIDDGRVRKANDHHKSMRHTFYVAAVIEINQSLRGILGVDVFVRWAMEIDGIFEDVEGENKLFSSEEYGCDNMAGCEWIVGFGPGMMVSFWAVHCLEDSSPMRFPRITLWKTLELQDFEVSCLRGTDLPNSRENFVLGEVVVSRNSVSSPPKTCSFIQLSPSNSLVWTHLRPQRSNSILDSPLNIQSLESTSCLTVGCLNLDGHAGKILQVAVHPYNCEVELAVSLDSNGLLLFWSLSTVSNCLSDHPTLIPAWELYGKLGTRDSCSKYTSMSWVPAVLDSELFLLMGHVGGIDCFIVKKYPTKDENIECHYLCTIPYAGHGPFEEGPTSIFSIPLPVTTDGILKSHKFMLLGIWFSGFKALSWEVTLHSYDLSGNSCNCNFESIDTADSSVLGYGITFSGRRYCVNAHPCSSQFPKPHKHDVVTSFAVLCPDSLVSQAPAPSGDQISSHRAYTMATGCSDGYLKLWRSKLGETRDFGTLWELVGLCKAHQGPISTVSLSDCGRKVATICKEFHSNEAITFSVWDVVHISGTGAFILEDTIVLDNKVVALNWLSLGDGHLLLGVCMPDKLCIYAQRCCGGQTLLNPGKSLKGDIWQCIAFAHTLSSVNDFLWGQRATAVVVHDSYFSVISQWLFLTDKQRQGEAPSNDHDSNCQDLTAEKQKNIIFADSDISKLTELSIKDADSKFAAPLNTKERKSCQFSHLLAATVQSQDCWDAKLGLWNILEVVDKLGGSLPVYHPEVLLMNIFTGNWKRAYSAVKHLVECLSTGSESGCATINSRSIVPQIPLSHYFEGSLPKTLPDTSCDWGRGGNATSITSSSQFSLGATPFSYNFDSDSSNNFLTPSSSKSELSSFIKQLEKFYKLADITDIEKTQILAVVDLLGEITNQHSAYGSLDESGQRFWISLKFQQLYFIRRFGRPATMDELVIDSSLIVWAYHSDCEENLFGSVIPNEASWPEMRNLGVGFWFTNTTQLRVKMEKLARLQYLKNKNPKDCALLYVVLNRIQVLAGLFKISKDEKDKPLFEFLLRNFKEEKNKAAALKNAYVLMGKHQLELAVTFFLLGGDIASAVNVCAKNLRDEQMALVICRLIEGYGGQSEHHLITKTMLPSAMEKGDKWLASLLEWELGNYYQSFMRMTNFQHDSDIENSLIFTKDTSFMEPNVGLYCHTLAAKNSLKNAVGEQNSAILGRWAILMTASALNRHGLFLESLECLSSSPTILGNMNQGNKTSFEHSDILHPILKPSLRGSNWLTDDVAFHLEYHAKLDLVLKYLSKLIREHPSWVSITVGSAGRMYSGEDEDRQYAELLESFRQKFYAELWQYEQKFSVFPQCIINKMSAALYNHGQLFVGYDLFCEYINRYRTQDMINPVDRFCLHRLINNPLFKVTDETSLLFSRFIAACSITSSQLKSQYVENGISYGSGLSESNASWSKFQCVLWSLWIFRASFRMICGSPSEDLTKKLLMVLDLIEYCIHLAYSWLQRNCRGLILLVKPLLISNTNGDKLYDTDVVKLKLLLPGVADVLFQSLVCDDAAEHKVSKLIPENQDLDVNCLIPDDERWKIIGVSLWKHVSRFIKHQLTTMSYKLEDVPLSGISRGRFSLGSSSTNLEPDENSSKVQIELVSLTLVKLLKTTVEHVSSHHVKQLASHLHKRREYGQPINTLVWLEESNQPQRVLGQNLGQDVGHLDTLNEKDQFDILWDICSDPRIISDSFAAEKIISLCKPRKPSKGWTETYDLAGDLDKAEEILNQEVTTSSSSATTETGVPAIFPPQSGHALMSSRLKDTCISKEIVSFLSPKEVLKRNGELLEALCFNSIYHGQAAVASNRKGILFFNWEDQKRFRKESDYIWSEADWPVDGWAGCESTPAPTCVSPGIGLGNKKGAHLGLGGATVGMGSFAKPRRDLTGGGAFGIPGYAGIGASGIGWETQEDFEDVVDPPPTVENISTRAFSSHPSRPIFLVGSSNTHIYLWEFGNNKASATYGVLPAANVPPPYALASVSALQFDPYGHRFASAALDGTVCTWQLEVGGRSNICPTETSHCFDGHASDVTYLTSSGSIIAVAGYSPSGVNVVIWDTLGPPTTSQASIKCHEGGARSLSVFDNDIGSGSVSPIIVTGGKGGDVGIHDFRYIATGKAKRHKHSSSGGQTIHMSSNTDIRSGNVNKAGEQNLNGMVWYIPKAHSGSVTKISTIPNTSLFLTGSKDGDVKLWDAKEARMLYHWPKLHERHTFLQPSSRGYGAVVRAGVTDIKVVSNGFLSCGGDGSVKLVELRD